MEFKNFDINEELCNKLTKNGINIPTEIQKKAIPEILSGKSIIGKSDTGTGKTLSYLIPMINSLYNGITDYSALILTPTRELVLQIFEEASKLSDNINILPIYGGKDIKAQISKLNSKIDLYIATPGRLIDHINRNTIDLSKLNTVVIDEVDQMLLMGFRNEVDFIISKIKKCNQYLLFSATIDSKVKKMAYKYSEEYSLIEINSESSIPELIEQKFIFTTDRSKFDDLCNFIDEHNPFMSVIFCRTKQRVDNLEEKMAQKGYNVDKIHSDVSQSKRERIMKNFRDLKIQFLISTDLFSRGIDVNGISHIINYDFPEKKEDYIHRIGRTGRIGKEGISVSFITDKNKSIYEEVKNIK